MFDVFSNFFSYRVAERVLSREYPKRTTQQLYKYELLFEKGVPSPFILIVFSWQSTQHKDDKDSD